MNSIFGQIFDPIILAVYESPVFYPKKHTKQNYAQQNRAAKKRRNKRK